MINGLGVLGWGVGGIEAEAVMLGQPIYMLTPQVVGFRLTGELPRWRDGHRSGADRRANAARQRGGGQVRRVLRRRPQQAQPAPTAPPSATWPRNMARRWASSRWMPRRSLSGRQRARRGIGRPGRTLLQGAGALPHRRDARSGLHRHARVGHEHGRRQPGRAEAAAGSGGAAAASRGSFAQGVPDAAAKITHHASRDPNAKAGDVDHGSVVLAAITSCTNTSNPSVMIGAGLVAKKAVGAGADEPSRGSRPAWRPARRW